MMTPDKAVAPSDGVRKAVDWKQIATDLYQSNERWGLTVARSKAVAAYGKAMNASSAPTPVPWRDRMLAELAEIPPGVDRDVLQAAIDKFGGAT